MKREKVKVGLLGVGLDTYWKQFDELLSRLVGYQESISSQINVMDAEVVNVGMADTPEKAKQSALLLKQADVEIVFLYISTYALSSTILPIAQIVNKPIVMLNVQPTSRIDYSFVNSMSDRGKMTGEWLAHCQACSVPEFASVFNRAGIKYDIITGYLSDKLVWEEVNSWIEASRVVYGLRNNRLGILGHYYCGMLDVYTDVTRLSATFGTHVEMLEMCELKALRDEVTDREIDEKLKEFHENFKVSLSCETAELMRAAQTSVALDKLVKSHQLTAMAYYYEGFQGNVYENIVTSVIPGNTLLTGYGIPIAGECEVKMRKQ